MNGTRVFFNAEMYQGPVENVYEALMLNKAFSTMQSYRVFDIDQCERDTIACCFSRVFQERSLQRRTNIPGEVTACNPILRSGTAKP